MIPAANGTNCWTKAEDLMVLVLLGCPSVPAFVGETNPAAARAGNMFLDGIPRATEDYTVAEWAAFFPNIVIGTPGDESAGFTLTPRSTGPNFAGTGVLEVQFAAVQPNVRAFKNSVGDIFEEMTNQAMTMREIAISGYGYNPEEDHESLGEILSCHIRVEWGTEAAGGGDS